MSNQKMVWTVVITAVVVLILSSKLRTLPLVNKIPTV